MRLYCLIVSVLLFINKNFCYAIAVPVCLKTFQRQCGLIDLNGNWLTEPQYENLIKNGPYWQGSLSRALAGTQDILDSNGQALFRSEFIDFGFFFRGAFCCTNEE